MEALLIETSRHISPYSHLFVEIVSMIQRNATAELEDHFGEGITLDMIFEYIPIIKEYLEREQLEYDFVEYDFVEYDPDVVRVEPETDIIQYNVNNTFQFIEECIICYENLVDLQFNCNHEFCGKCIKTYIEIKAEPSCPKCRALITHITYNSNSMISCNTK